MDYSRPLLASRLAAEYAAGVMRGGARRRFVNLLPAHPTLRRALADCEGRLVPLTAVVPPVAPPASVWPRIEARIGGVSAPAMAPSWWSRVAVWRGFAGFAGTAALALMVFVALPEPAHPPIVVVLNASPEAATAGLNSGVVPASFVASIRSDGRAMVTRPLTPVSMGADRALELWAVRASGAPRSLGVISGRAPTVVQRGKELEGTEALAVTIEPPGGSPSGAPTGPIVYVGKIS